MSTRWYPIYRKGNPQLRIFLPNFWLKVVKPEEKQPPFIVQFHCSMEMTIHDIKNYLTKIYKLPVINVRTRIAMGKTRPDPVQRYVVKDDDVKIAYVTMPKDFVFNFPDIFSSEAQQAEIDENQRTMDEYKAGFKKYVDRNKARPGVPSWFTI